MKESYFQSLAMGLPGQYVFGGPAAALASVGDGDVLRFWTADCFDGRIRHETDVPSQLIDLSKVNPVTGPIHVEGAKPGDTLAIHFASIRPVTGFAVSCTFPHFGALTSSHDTPSLQPALPEKVWRYTVDPDSWQVSFQPSGQRQPLIMPLDPMHGTVGVAPAGGQVLSTLTCGPHGGNMDIPAVRAGTTVYLQVNVDGAMFGIGDGHARQGHGEACGVGVECAMETTVVVGLIPDTPTPAPRFETDDQLMSVGAGRPLEDAYRKAQIDMISWLRDLTGLTELDALQWLSQAGTTQVGNVCDPLYTMVAQASKTLFRAGDMTAAYHGTHQRLRAVTARSR